nr:hypothetical protein [Escherichia coli]
MKQVLRAYIFCGACGNNRTNRGGFQFAAARLPWFTLPVTFIALNNPFIEVSGAIAALTAMISPELKAANVGGRIPERVTLNIGRRINITDVAIQDLSFDLDAPRDSNGYFLKNTVNLQLTGSSIYNSSDIVRAFQ